MIAPDDNLNILDYNRVVKDLNGMSKDKFIEEIKKVFEVSEIKCKTYKLSEKDKIGMYLDNKWYEIKIDKNTKILQVTAATPSATGSTELNIEKR